VPPAGLDHDGKTAFHGGNQKDPHMHIPHIIGFAGWSGAGKTTLVAGLIPVLTARGITVSTIKHAHHDFDIDKPGKDSYEHRRAGATEVLVASGNRWALLHELRGAPEPDLHELLTKLAPVDIVLVEGFKRSSLVKIEVHRPSVGKKLIYPDDPAVVAVASDVPMRLPSTLTGLALDDLEAIADFVLARAVPAKPALHRTARGGHHASGVGPIRAAVARSAKVIRDAGSVGAPARNLPLPSSQMEQPG
jgi:molybdopterin-guanine dinucleotide biosynthesis protein B